MAATVFTGWRTVTPGECFECGSEDDYECDGRGNITCGCQACLDCGLVDAYGMHNPGCPALDGDGESGLEAGTKALIVTTRDMGELASAKNYCRCSNLPYTVDGNEITVTDWADWDRRSLALYGIVKVTG